MTHPVLHRRRAAVVTDAAGGSGLAPCERFAPSGTKLYQADLDEAQLAEAR